MFEAILRRSGGKPKELNTDQGSAFTDKASQAVLHWHGITQRVNGPKDVQDSVSVDRAIQHNKTALAKNWEHGFMGRSA